MTTTKIYHRDGREKTVDVHEASRLVGTGTVGADKEWSLTKPSPRDWEKEVPRYKVTRDVHPSPKARHRDEPPFGMMIDSDMWQYADRIYKAGETIETKHWPHPSFVPLTYGAKKVLNFLSSQQKSRLTTSPWYIDQIRLDDGMSGPTIVKPTVAQLEPMSLRPVA
jgi:hypothetical protein